MKAANCFHCTLIWLLVSARGIIHASFLGTSEEMPLFQEWISEVTSTDNPSSLISAEEVIHNYYSGTPDETSLYHEWTSEATDSDNQSSLEDEKHDNEVNETTWKCVLSNRNDETPASKVLYNKHKVYTLHPTTQEQIDALLDLEKNNSNSRRETNGSLKIDIKMFISKILKQLDFWTLVRLDGPVEIMTSPKTYPILKNFTKEHNLTTTVRIEDVQKLIDLQLPPPNSTNHSFNWDYFYDLDKIYTWMDSIETNYSDVLTPLVIGCSYEGRPIRGVKLSKKRNNPGIFIEAGTHAREWIATTTALWIIEALLTSGDAKIKKISEYYDWYIFPTVNPDGYHYSYVTNRFWRKSRSPGPDNCTGVDTNRNWNFHWSGSGDPCSLIYPGPEPFSEKETLRLSEYVTKIRDKIQVYLDFHSYSQILMFPYSYTTNHTDDYDVYMSIANKSAAALKSVYGTEYVVGDIASTVYIADGSSVDWMYGVLKIPLCFAYELRDKGHRGMLLPPDEIIPTANETLVSIRTILESGDDIIWNDYEKRNQ